MGMSMVSGNLNTMCDLGQFEADRSTWGLTGGMTPGIVVQRSLDQAHAGLYSAKITTNVSSAVFPRVIIMRGSFNAQHNKQYVLRCWVYVPNTDQLADDDWEIAINGFSDSSGPINYTQISQTRKTFLQCKGAWQQIETKILVTMDNPGDWPTGAALSWLIYLVPDGATITDGQGTWDIGLQGLNYPNGNMFLDQYEIYEYIDVPDVCDLAIDAGASTVVNETTPMANDGSITIVATGGDGTLEYSKNGGSTWQSSNVFTGLDSGVYDCRVREVDHPTCVAAHAFSVNADDPDFSFITSVTNESVPDANNGSVLITVTGTTGPYQYSKSGSGGPWQSGNTFTGLAPGSYVIAVKDSLGIVQGAVIEIEEAELVFQRAYFSRNWIPFVLAPAVGWEAMDNYKLYCETHVLNPESNVYELVFKQDLPPDADGAALFNLRPAFRGVLKANAPFSPITSITAVNDRLRIYKNKTGYLEDDETTPAALTESDPYLVVLGGVSKFHYPTINYFIDYLPTHKKFMTWAPLEKLVDRNQEDYLNFFVYNRLITALKLKLKVYFDDATNTTVTKEESAASYGMLAVIPAGPSNLSVGTIDPDKNVVKYELWIEDQTSTAISETRTFKISPTHHPRTRFLMFLNSLGAYEVHRFTGVGQAAEQYNRTIVQKFLGHDYDALEGELETNEVTSQRGFSFSSGYFTGANAREWQEYMRDLVRTTRLYDVTSGARIPLVVETSKFDIDEDQNYERFIRLDVREAYVNENYTPDEV